MKKFLLLLLAPLLMSTQCESDDEPIFNTEFLIQNNTDQDIIYLTFEDNEVLIKSQSHQFIAVSSNTVSFVKPTENIAFDEVQLYSKNGSGSLTLIYEQNPIVDSLWTFSKLSTYKANFKLIINNQLLD